MSRPTLYRVESSRVRASVVCPLGHSLETGLTSSEADRMARRHALCSTCEEPLTVHREMDGRPAQELFPDRLAWSLSMALDTLPRSSGSETATATAGRVARALLDPYVTTDRNVVRAL